jgi:hypothetical protein
MKQMSSSCLDGCSIHEHGSLCLCVSAGEVKALSASFVTSYRMYQGRHLPMRASGYLGDKILNGGA